MREFDIGLALGIFVTLAFAILIIVLSEMKTPMTWCSDIAETNKTEPYKVVYDRCMKEYEDRKEYIR